MSNKRSLWTTLAALALSLTITSFSLAQDNGGAPPAGGQGAPPPADNGGGPGGPGGQGGRRRFDPQQMMQDRLDRIKEDLGANDDEWNALQPKVQKVMQMQFEMMRGRFGMRRRGGDQGGPPQDDQSQQNAVQKATSDLRAAVNANASASDLQAKLQALRDARTQAQADMTKAQADLKSVLTQRQEAQLVLDGILE